MIEEVLSHEELLLEDAAELKGRVDVQIEIAESGPGDGGGVGATARHGDDARLLQKLLELEQGVRPLGGAQSSCGR
jgi:hypothetical protein